jgi:eukaryotic-like serine/threonine-protein kinase
MAGVQSSLGDVPACPQCANAYNPPTRFCGLCGTSLPEVPAAADDEAADPWLGRVVDRRYRVLARIGVGGMGMVYRVEHVQLAKIAAMKVLHADTARDSEMVRRFRLEAQAVSLLNHPNIVQTFDFGQWEGSLYLVMEYVRGDDLAVIVKREGPMPFAQAAPLFVQVCSALTEAHEAGVIHRDLKPENIVVVRRRDGSEHAKVLDFGLAKLHERVDGAEITSGGQVIGTPYYMSPEQVRAESLDVRTDIYSLGATFYRVVTGTPPFQAATPVGVLTKHITDELEPPRSRAPDLGLPPQVDEIVSRAMAKAREDRYASSDEVKRALERAIESLRGAPPAGDPAPAIRPPRRSQVTTTALPPSSSASPRASAQASTRPPTPRSPRASFPAAAEASDRGDSGDRLRRQDFDAFERSLRRKKVIASLLLPAFVLAAAAAGYWALGRTRERPRASEQEPNNAPGYATLIPLDTPVQGWIGKHLEGQQPDMDYFRLPTGKGPRVVSARLEGVPDTDLVLEVYDGQGRSLAKCDAQGAGSGEWLQPTEIGPTEAYLLVRPVWIQGTPPAEKVAEPYRLSVHWAAPRPGWEVEPNDWPERATAAQPGRPVRGYLGTPDDQDLFLYTPQASGRLTGQVTPPAGVEVVLSIEGKPVARGHQGGHQGKTGDIDVAVEAGKPVLVGVARKPRKAAAAAGTADPKTRAPAGLDDPYELRLELRAEGDGPPPSRGR